MKKRAKAVKEKHKIYRLKLPEALALVFEGKLEEIEATAQVFFQVQVRGFLRQGATFDVKDVITFGKYEGEVLEDVIKVNPGYVKWMIRNTTNFKVTMAAAQFLNQILNEDDEEDVGGIEGCL